jgi:gluconate 2-dehydrogenase gamma chain
VEQDGRRAGQAPEGLTRRDFLRGAALGTAALLSAPAILAGAAQAEAAAPEALSESEYKILSALVDRLIPADATGPGAIDAHVPRYIDRALAGDYRAGLPAYRHNLAAIDAYARHTYGSGMADLPAATRDAVVTALEAGKIPGVVSLVGVDLPCIKFALFPEVQGTFFAVLMQHTREGMFGDPLYGGNHNFIGWDLIGYPGVNPVNTATDQRLGTRVPLAHRSAATFGARPATWSIPEHRVPGAEGA